MMINSNTRIAKSNLIRFVIQGLRQKHNLFDGSNHNTNNEVVQPISKLIMHISQQMRQVAKKIPNISPLFYRQSNQFSTTSPNPTRISQQRILTSKNLSTLLNEPKQYQYLLTLLEKFITTSKVSIFQGENSSCQSGQQLNQLILNPLKDLSQQINMFMVELEIEKKAGIGKKNWQDGRERYYREDLLIQFEERKLFYNRLERFLDSAVRQLEAVPFSSHRPQSGTKQNTQGSKSPEQEFYTGISGQLFKQNFIADHSNELYEWVKQSKQDYLMKSQKLKYFNIFQLKTYESNFAMKLRLLIRVLAEIKHIYQFHLILRHQLMKAQQESNDNQKPSQSTNQLNPLPSLDHFLSYRVISPSQYSQLLTAYFNQFSQQNLKSHLFMSIGFHSQDIAELNKELIDVKIRQTNFSYDINRLVTVFIFNQHEWLFNALQDESEWQFNLGNSTNTVDNNKTIYNDHHLSSKFTRDFNSHKIHVLNMAKLIIKQLKNEHQKNAQSHHFSQQQVPQNHISSKSLQQFNEPMKLYHQRLNLTFNQLLPHRFFTISDINQLLSLIQEDIIPLMLNPHQVYQRLSDWVKFSKLKINGDDKQVKGLMDQYECKVHSLLREAQENMLFMSRFLEWDIHMVLSYKDFLGLFYQNQKDNILTDLYHVNLPQSNLTHKEQFLFTPTLFKFIRVINIVYHMINELNPIYIEDYIRAIDSVRTQFREFILNDLCRALSTNPFSLLQAIDDRVMVRLIEKRNYSEEEFCPSMLRFRFLAVFLDVKLITYPEFFTLLLRTQQTNTDQSMRDLASSPQLSFLYYSNGLQKTLRILAEFSRNNTQKDYSFTVQPFALFESLIYQYQRNFNFVINKLQRMESNDEIFNKNIKQDQNSFQNHRQPIRFNQSSSTSSQFELSINSQKLSDTLVFFKQNDLMDRAPLMDEEIFIRYLSKIHPNQQNYHNHRELTSQNSFEKIVQSDSPQKLIKRKNFTDPINILAILSQNTNFISSTMQMTYFNYLKVQIQELYSFDKFICPWNFPFCADLAVEKKRNLTGNVQRLYVKILPHFGVKGRTRFYRQELTNERDFMRINRFNDFEGKERLFQRVHTKNKLLGVVSRDKQIIQLGIQIDKSHDIVSFIAQWVAGEFRSISKPKTRDSFLQLS